MKKIQSDTIPSLSGTFGIPTRLALTNTIENNYTVSNPEMPKEPSSPSRSNALTEKHFDKIVTNRLRNNNGQRTTRGIKHWGLRGCSSVLTRIKLGVTLPDGRQVNRKVACNRQFFIPPTVPTR